MDVLACCARLMPGRPKSVTWPFFVAVSGAPPPNFGVACAVTVLASGPGRSLSATVVELATTTVAPGASSLWPSASSPSRVDELQIRQRHVAGVAHREGAKVSLSPTVAELRLDWRATSRAGRRSGRSRESGR